MKARDHRLRVLLVERPSTHRDGKQLQLELEGYEVTATWELGDAERALPEVAFTYLVIGASEEAARWQRLLQVGPPAPVLVFSDLGREGLAAAGMTLRPEDVCAKPRN